MHYQAHDGTVYTHNKYTIHPYLHAEHAPPAPPNTVTFDASNGVLHVPPPLNATFMRTLPPEPPIMS